MMKAVNPYLNFNGNAEEAVLFYPSIFGGRFSSIQPMKDIQGMPAPEGMEGKDHADSLEEGLQLYDRLSEGVEAYYLFQKQFWGAWHGGLVDKFGIRWMVNYEE